MKSLFLALLFFLFLSGCRKDKQKHGGPPEKMINASVITPRDPFGVPTGNPDPTDWKSTENWTPREEMLLSFTDTIQALDMERSDTMHVVAFPNPARDVINLQFQFSQGPVKLKMVIVNEALQVIQRETYLLRPFPGFPSINLATAINLASASYQSGNYYRVYYAVYDNRGLAYFKGHGDFHIL